MLKAFSILCLIYLAVATQGSVVTAEGPMWCRLFLPALALVAIAFWSEGPAAIAWSACLGLLLDGLSLDRLGVQLGLATLLGCSLQIVREQRRTNGVATFIGMVFVVTFVWRAASPFVLGLLDGKTTDVSGVIAMSLVEAVATTGLAAVIVCGDRLVMGSSRRVVA